MVETVVALLLFLNGNMVEHVYKDSLKVCNESKKIAEKVVNPLNVTFVCKEIKAKMNKYQTTSTSTSNAVVLQKMLFGKSKLC